MKPRQWAVHHFTPPDYEAEGPSYIEVQGAQRDPGQWFLCEHPEKRLDRLTAIHDCCRSCLVGAQAAHRRGEVEDDLIHRLVTRLDAYGPAPHLHRPSDG